MRVNHVTIILDFVPGGCTGADQPCDVGIQRPFKLLLKQSFHEDVVNVCLDQIRSKSESIKFDDHIGTLRDASVR